MNAHEGAEVARNRGLAERIAAGKAVGSLDEVMATIRQMAAAHLDVPGPRAAQLADEIDRLRKIEEAAAEFIHTGGTWSHNELVCALDGKT
jgi:hypothetical protein